MRLKLTGPGGITGRLLGAVSILALGAGLLGAWSPPAVAASPQPVFGVRPAQEGATPLPGGHFDYALPAGSTISDAVVVENLTAAPISLTVYPAGLIPLAGGGFGVTQLGKATTGAGSWITVSHPAVELAPRQQEAVPFRLTVPSGTFSGDYGGAVVAQNEPTPSHGVAVQYRAGLQVRVHVTGVTAHLQAAVGPLGVHQTGNGVQVSVTLTNTGNETFEFGGRVLVHRSGSAGDLRVGLSPSGDYLFPGEQVVLSGTWGHPPRWGSASAHAVVTVTPALGPPETISGPQVGLHFFPWWLVIMAVLALLLLIAAVVLAWRQRQQWRSRFHAATARRRAVRRFKQQLDAATPEEAALDRSGSASV